MGHCPSSRMYVCLRASALLLMMSLVSARAAANDIQVLPGGSLQAAIDAAQPGDTIWLDPTGVYVGNFRLRNKGTSTAYITIRSSASDVQLPADGVRVTPAYSSLLPKIKSGNGASALATDSGAHHWRLMFLEFQANNQGYNDLIVLGDGSSAQNDLSLVPHDLVLDRVLVRGDPVYGQKRGISLNAANVTIANSWVSDCKGVGMDTQAIAGWNGPGPFLIENNYLEGATENILFGGADPAIPNMVPTGITVRHNHLYKPFAWRDPIFATPANVVARTVAGAGGTLGAGTYAYRVVALGPVGQGNTGRSAASVEVTAPVVNPGDAVRISWSAVTNATYYKVYGRKPGAEGAYWTVTSTTFTDTGTTGITEAVPTSAGSVWTVKNLFELKNARQVLVEGNVLEDHWQQAQPGHAVLFTVRDQGGTCPWCEVGEVTFQYNTLRHAGAAFNILGYDNNQPSGQAHDLRVLNNLIVDINSSTYGGPGVLTQIGNQPANVTFDHNTVDHTNNVVTAYFGTIWPAGGGQQTGGPIVGFRFTNNLLKHNAYGIIGDGYGPGNPTIAAYFPSSLITANTLAGGSASIYPAGNYFPTVSAWMAQFTDYANGNYTLSPTSPYRGAGTDGLDLGADMTRVQAESSIALSGNNSGAAAPAPVQIVTTSLPAATVGTAYSTTLAATGGSGSYQWSVVSGTLPPGLSLAASGSLGGTPATTGTFTFMVETADANDAANTTQQTFTLPVTDPPVQITTASLAGGVVGSAYSAAITATGGCGTYTWSVTSGQLPAGLTLNASTGALAGTPTTGGTSMFTAQAADTSDATNLAQRSYTLPIASATVLITTAALADAIVGTPYSATFTATGGSGSYVWTVASGTLPGGLTLSSSGLLSGTPTAAGSFAFIVQTVDSSDATSTAQKPFSLTVGTAPIQIVTTSLPDARRYVAYSVTLVASGGKTPYTWSLVSGALPNGVTLSATGTISGKPRRRGNFNFTVRVVDSSVPATSATRSLTLKVR